MPTKEKISAAAPSAEDVLRELMERRGHLLAARDQLDAERKGVSYGALVQHDAEQVKRLNEINAELLHFDADMAALDAAIAEAESRAAQAKRAEAVAIDRQKARRVRVALNKLAMAGRAIDQSLDQLVERSNAMRAALMEIHALGCPFPSHEQLVVLGERALRTGLHQTLWSRYFEIVQPNERKTFAALVQAWEAVVENNIRPRLEQTEAA
jgi:hypothetical protein